MTHDIYAQMRETVLTALRTIVADLPDDVAARVEVTPNRDPAHGDISLVCGCDGPRTDRLAACRQA